MAFCCFWRGKKRLLVFKKGDSSFLFDDSLHRPLYWEDFGPGVWDWGREREETMFGICKKKNESFPHVKLRMSSSCSQMSCDGSFNVCFYVYKIIKYIHHL